MTNKGITRRQIQRDQVMGIDTEKLIKTYVDFTDKELLRWHASGTLAGIAYDISDSNFSTL